MGPEADSPAPVYVPHPDDVNELVAACEAVERGEGMVVTPEQLRVWAETGEWPASLSCASDDAPRVDSTFHAAQPQGMSPVITPAQLRVGPVPTGPFTVQVTVPRDAPTPQHRLAMDALHDDTYALRRDLRWRWTFELLPFEGVYRVQFEPVRPSRSMAHGLALSIGQACAWLITLFASIWIFGARRPS